MNFTDDSAALFPTMARSNHSCTPNSEFITREKLGNNRKDGKYKHVIHPSICLVSSNSNVITIPLIGVQDLVATRSIKEGEEITLSYIPAADEGSDERKV